MSLEIVVGWIIKIIWLPLTGFVGYFFWSAKKDKEKLDNVYTKHETETLLELKALALQQEFQLTNKAMSEKMDFLTQMVTTELKQSSDERKEIKFMLNNIHTQVKVMEMQIKNIEEDIDEMQADLKEINKTR